MNDKVTSLHGTVNSEFIKKMPGEEPVKLTPYSALHKYWNSKDKIALLAVESRH